MNKIKKEKEFELPKVSKVTIENKKKRFESFFQKTNVIEIFIIILMLLSILFSVISNLIQSY